MSCCRNCHGGVESRDFGKSFFPQEMEDDLIRGVVGGASVSSVMCGRYRPVTRMHDMYMILNNKYT